MEWLWGVDLRSNKLGSAPRTDCLYDLVLVPDSSQCDACKTGINTKEIVCSFAHLCVLKRVANTGWLFLSGWVLAPVLRRG